MENSYDLINMLYEIEKPEFGGKNRVVTLEDVNSLLKEGVDPSFDDNQAVKLAICLCSNDIIKVLLANKRVDPTNIMINVDVRNSVVNNTEILELLARDERVDFSINKNRTIFIAERDGHEEAKELLLQNKKVRDTYDPKVKHWKS